MLNMTSDLSPNLTATAVPADPQHLAMIAVEYLSPHYVAKFSNGTTGFRDEPAKDAMSASGAVQRLWRRQNWPGRVSIRERSPGLWSVTAA